MLFAGICGRPCCVQWVILPDGGSYPCASPASPTFTAFGTSPYRVSTLAGLPFEHRMEAVAARVKEMGADWLINTGAVGFSLDYDRAAAVAAARERAFPYGKPHPGHKQNGSRR